MELNCEPLATREKTVRTTKLKIKTVQKSAAAVQVCMKKMNGKMK
jgi:hypothetical protein